MTEQVVKVDSRSRWMRDVLQIRTQVFVDEQAIPAELERDENDGRAVHFVVLCDGMVVGTVRLVSNGGSATVGRLAVTARVRGRGIGRKLMDHAEAEATSLGVAEIALHAQMSVVGFYERLGYVKEGDAFVEVGIPHVLMRKRLG